MAFFYLDPNSTPYLNTKFSEFENIKPKNFRWEGHIIFAKTLKREPLNLRNIQWN